MDAAIAEWNRYPEALRLEAIICLQKASANIDNASKIAVGWSSRATRINAEFGSDHDRIHYHNDETLKH